MPDTLTDADFAAVAARAATGDRKPTDPARRSLDLVIVGTGIRTVGQMTVEAMAWIEAPSALS